MAHVGCDRCCRDGLRCRRATRVRGLCTRSRGREHLGDGGAVGVVHAAVHWDVVAADVRGILVHLIRRGCDQRLVVGGEAFQDLADLGTDRAQVAEQFGVEPGLEDAPCAASNWSRPP